MIILIRPTEKSHLQGFHRYKFLFCVVWIQNSSEPALWLWRGIAYCSQVVQVSWCHWSFDLWVSFLTAILALIHVTRYNRYMLRMISYFYSCSGFYNRFMLTFPHRILVSRTPKYGFFVALYEVYTMLFVLTLGFFLFTGTGKTHTLKHTIQKLAGNVIVCASTGLSGVILSGLQMQAKTVHSLFGLMDCK